MKRRTGVCILICVLCILLAGGGFILLVPENKTDKISNSETQMQEFTKEIGLTQEYYAYIIFERDGRLSVYYGDNETLYMETGILKEYLPEELREELKVGIRFATQDELFDFLESYSS